MTKLEKARLRQAVADYMASEGCSCCRDDGAHEAAYNRLGELLGVPRYSDDSGYDFQQFKTRRP